MKTKENRKLRTKTFSTHRVVEEAIDRSKANIHCNWEELRSASDTDATYQSSKSSEPPPHVRPKQ